MRPLELPPDVVSRWALPPDFVGAVAAALAVRPAPDFLADVWLARAAAGGFHAAIVEFEKTCVDPLRLDEDVKQELLERLLAGATPKLAGYRGSGPLRAWTRAVATRLALARAPHQTQAATDERLAVLASPLDVALDVARRQHGAALQRAFSDALDSIGPGDRTVLRLHYLQGLSLERLAVMYSCHRSTIVRRLTSVREAIFSATRALLVERLQLSEPDLDSLLRLGRDQLTISLRLSR